MKNITLSVDEQILAEVRRYAAERDATVNAMVRDYLTRISEHSDRAGNAREQIRELSESSQARVGSARWRRENLHAR